MVLAPVILILSLFIDRIFGDPQSRLHPVALLGSLIDKWGHPEYYRKSLQRLAGVVFAVLTAFVFVLPFAAVDYLSAYSGASIAAAVVTVIVSAFMLKICFAFRCLEEHVLNVENAVKNGGGQAEVQMMVSRDTEKLSGEEILSGAYESMSENLVDSIVSPLFYFMAGNLAGAALLRAVNTMDAMLGYKDERIRIGWFAARCDDVMNYIPARIAGVILLAWFALRGRFRPAWSAFKTERKKRAGFNGGIPMSLIAGGCETAFIKPGVYVIGENTRKKPLSEAKDEIFAAVRFTSAVSAVIFAGIMYLCGGCLILWILKVIQIC